LSRESRSMWRKMRYKKCQILNFVKNDISEFRSNGYLSAGFPPHLLHLCSLYPCARANRAAASSKSVRLTREAPTGRDIYNVVAACARKQGRIDSFFALISRWCGREPVEKHLLPKHRRDLFPSLFHRPKVDCDYGFLERDCVAYAR
jgi:hypothetical protein